MKAGSPHYCRALCLWVLLLISIVALASKPADSKPTVQQQQYWHPDGPRAGVAGAGTGTGEEWCAYLQATPEPDLIVYPRIPKAGSTTIKRLIEAISARNNLSYLWSTPHFVGGLEMWVDLDNNQKQREIFVSQINLMKEHHPAKTLIVDGHFRQIGFSPAELGAQRLEYISLARQCEPRLKSQFFYNLHDSVDAQKGMYDGNKYKQYWRWMLHAAPEDVASMDDCVRDKACLRHSGRFGKNYTDLSYMFCGSRCVTDYMLAAGKHHAKTHPTGRWFTTYGQGIAEAYERGGHRNMMNFSAFAVAGTTERIGAFVEMLECAYPTALGGITELYKAEQLHANIGTHHNGSVALGELISEVCNPAENVYARLHAVLTKSSNGIYEHMQAHRDGCCRVAKTGRGGRPQ